MRFRYQTKDIEPQMAQMAQKSQRVPRATRLEAMAHASGWTYICDICVICGFSF